MPRAYIIGNGLSLNKTNLDLIAGQPSYACNRIALLYDRTKWRPTVYVHPENWGPNVDHALLHINMGVDCRLAERFWEFGLEHEYPNVKWIKECHHWYCNFDSPDVPDEWHLPQPCTFGGSVNVMMQMAILDGYDDLILLGCDLQYRDNFPSHFDIHYETGDEQPAFTASKNALWGHIQAMNYIKRKAPHICVRNATPGGTLEVWERVKYEDVASE